MLAINTRMLRLKRIVKCIKMEKKKDTNPALLAAGKLALAARLVTTANAKNLSARIIDMEAALDAYDSEIVALI